MRLENWYITLRCRDPYKAPEQCIPAVAGDVFGNDRFNDGQPVTTNYLVGQRNGNVVTKSGSEYELGVINPDYAMRYPNARKELFAGLKELTTEIV